MALETLAGAAFAIDNPPTADSPGGVVALLKWCWTQKDAQRYRDLFTADYQFIPQAPDIPAKAWLLKTKEGADPSYIHVLELAWWAVQNRVADAILDRDQRADMDQTVGQMLEWAPVSVMRSSIIFGARGGKPIDMLRRDFLKLTGR